MCEFSKTMKLAVALFFVVQFVSVDSNCVFDKYSIDPASQPIFIQKIGRKHFLMPTQTFGLLLVESSFLEVYCPHGFRREGLSSSTQDHISTETNSVQIKCAYGKIKVREDEGFYEFDEEDKLSCSRPALSAYETHHLMCPGVSYVIGFEHKQESVILAEICYDLENMKAHYLNYISAKRSPVISHQEQYSPIRFYPFGEGAVDIPSASFNLPIETISQRTQDKVGVVHKSVEYIYESLMPSDVFMPFFTEPLFATNFLGKTLWWKSLKMGNWHLFETVLKSRSQSETYDVVLGTSGSVTVPSSSPDCELMTEFSFEINSITQTPPLLVWAYLTAANYTLREEFVVIGVNTPYFEYFSRSETIICYDICNRIEWLQPLNKFRRISAFGYIYCCDVREVRNKLDGIPDIHLKRQHEYEQKARPDEPDYKAETEPEPNSDEEAEKSQNFGWLGK